MATVKMMFQSEDYARGFAEGIEHVNDSAISNVQVARADPVRNRWFVSFDDEDAPDNEAETQQ